MSNEAEEGQGGGEAPGRSPSLDAQGADTLVTRVSGCSSLRPLQGGGNMGQGISPLWGVGATPRLGGIGSGATFAGRSPLAPCKGKVPNPRSGWCNLLHQLTDGVSRATLECSK